jgi:hypothetical protein
MSATYKTTQATATGKLRAADFPMTEPLRHILGLSVLALMLAMPIAHADDGAKPEAIQLGEHPAVLVARRGVQVDPTSKFYLHPAQLSWSLKRPMPEGEQWPVPVASRVPDSTIDSR